MVIILQSILLKFNTINYKYMLKHMFRILYNIHKW
nr:MAG TPA: hypothetical protein [Caudoviricetes sp.]DAT99440.1 MAG TPA: hypothetical protein [Caudoviricetes sp.]